MSVPAFAWAIEQGREHKLHPSERLVLIYLADKANGVRYAWPSQETVSAYTGLTTRTIHSCTKRLVELGLIRVEARGKALGYHILRPLNGEDHQKPFPVTPASPETISGISPETISGDRPLTGNGEAPHRKSLPVSPETISAKPLREPRKEEPKPARASATEPAASGQRAEGAPSAAPAPALPKAPTLGATVGGGNAYIPARPPKAQRGPEPTQAEINANRDRQLLELARGCPELAAVVRNVAGAWRHIEPQATL